MKNANEIYEENPIYINGLLSDEPSRQIKHLIWLGQVEVINHIAADEEQKLDLLKQVRWIEFFS